MTNTTPVPEEAWVTTRIAHLQMLQTLIERMSAASNHIKVANTGIVTAVASLAASLENPNVAVIALPVVLLLAALDAYYLTLERGFRGAFDRLRVTSITGLADFAIKGDGKLSFQSALISPSVWPYHLVLLAIVLAAVVFVEPSQAHSIPSASEG